MVGVGLIGFGVAGASFHAPLIAATPELTLAAVVSSRPDAVHSRHPGARVFADVDAMLTDQTIDLVVVATPNDRHAPLARAALEHGKHVVVDKPLVAGPADGPALLALAAERGRMLTVFHNRRWDADFLTVERLVKARTLGEIRFAELAWDRFRPAIKPGWREQPGAGAGLLADLGPHLVDQALRLFGVPEAVAGDIAVQRDEAMVDDWFRMTWSYGERRVSIAASTLVAAPRPRFALHGTDGSFVKSGIDPQEAVLRAGGLPTDAGFGVETPAAHGRVTDAAAAVVAVPSERGDWRRFYQGVADAVLRGAPPPVDPADALIGLDLIELARRSAAEGRILPYR